MYQTTSNITSKYCQETHYNYVKNSGFGFQPSPGKKETQRQAFPTSEHGITTQIF